MGPFPPSAPLSLAGSLECWQLCHQTQVAMPPHQPAPEVWPPSGFPATLLSALTWTVGGQALTNVTGGEGKIEAPSLCHPPPAALQLAPLHILRKGPRTGSPHPSLSPPALWEATQLTCHSPSPGTTEEGEARCRGTQRGLAGEGREGPEETAPTCSVLRRPLCVWSL